MTNSDNHFTAKNGCCSYHTYVTEVNKTEKFRECNGFIQVKHVFDSS